MEVILGPLFKILIMVIQLYIWVVVINVILSWLVAFNVVNPQNKVVYMIGDFVYRLTEPPLRKLRSVLPDLGTFDISPIILILGLIFLEGVLRELAVRVVT